MHRILIIDDEPDFCGVLEAYLGRKGYDTDVATSAEAAFAALSHSQPDLVLMDVRMPDTSGLELLPQIKAASSASYVIVVTALNDYRVEDLLYEAGADGYLTKPVRLEELGQSIQDLLSPHPTPPC